VRTAGPNYWRTSAGSSPSSATPGRSRSTLTAGSLARSARPREPGTDVLGPGPGVARMARFGVRSGSVAFARSKKIPANSPFERTGANGSERSLALAMQKVVGSSPIIRFQRPCRWGAQDAPEPRRGDRLQVARATDRRRRVRAVRLTLRSEIDALPAKRWFREPRAYDRASLTGGAARRRTAP
jgi:hypothetical protein